MNPYVWLLVAGAAAAIEAFTTGLFTMWFVIGALVAFVVQYFGGPLWLQLVVFLAVSLACLVLLRPLIMKHRKRGEEFESTPVGSIAVVVERIDPAAMTGRVETPNHMSWSALSADGTVIEEGANVRVVDSKSIKLIVERI